MSRMIQSGMIVSGPERVRTGSVSGPEGVRNGFPEGQARATRSA